MIMEDQNDIERFKNLSFDDFRRLASDDALSKYQKIGFPDSYRQGKEHLIFGDIVQKLGLKGAVDGEPGYFLDVGPGCSDLPKLLIDHAHKHNLRTILVDSKEMLDLLPSIHAVLKYEGFFPNDMGELLNRFKGKVDFIVGYSIFHYVFYNSCIFRFLDAAISLLKPGGRMLLGDIPNISKRRRFFSTAAGVKFHQDFTGSDTLPEVHPFRMEEGQIDDGVLLGIVQRYRNFGLEAYLLPQPASLHFHNRREDLLICKS